MLHRGAKPGAVYRGAYKPGKLYKGARLIAGYEDVAKAAPASWAGTYDDVMGVTATGKGKQQTYSGAQLLDISTCTINSFKPYGLTITRDGDVVKIQGTAVPDQNEDINFLVLLWAPNTDLSGKGYVITPFFLQGSIEKVYGLRNAEETAIACGLILTEGAAVDVALRLMVSVDTPTAYEPYVGGKPSPSPGYPQPLVAAESALTASGRTGTTPTTVTLPTLRGIPGTDIRDTLAYIGNGQWQVTRRVGVTVVDGEAIAFTGGEWWNLPAGSSPGVGEVLVTTTSSGITLYGNSGAGFLFTQQAWAAGVESADALNALCQVTPMTIWYALASPATETVTLGELPSYPVHTELDISGDYPPTVVGTVKVGI